MGWLGTIYAFPDVKTNKERTRIIIFATDNSVAGKETITLAEACKLCKQYNINLYAYCPSIEMNEYVTAESLKEYKNAVEGMANGKFYTGNLTKMTSSMINEVESTKKTLLKTSKKTYAIDYPQIPFMCILISFAVLVIIEKRIKI